MTTALASLAGLIIGFAACIVAIVALGGAICRAAEWGAD